MENFAFDEMRYWQQSTHQTQAMLVHEAWAFSRQQHPKSFHIERIKHTGISLILTKEEEKC